MKITSPFSWHAFVHFRDRARHFGHLIENYQRSFKLCLIQTCFGSGTIIFHKKAKGKHNVNCSFRASKVRGQTNQYDRRKVCGRGLQLGIRRCLQLLILQVSLFTSLFLNSPSKICYKIVHRKHRCTKCDPLLRTIMKSCEAYQFLFEVKISARISYCYLKYV